MAAAVFLMASSCEDEQVLGETSGINLNFKAVYADDPLVCQNSDFQYKYPDGREIRFTSFEFFISEVSLVEEASSDEAEVFDIEYVNLTENTTLEDAERAVTLAQNNIPSGSYKAIKIGIGVPTELNNTTSSELGVNHPLRKFGDFWSGWGSYIFMKIGGAYDIEGDGLGNGTDTGITHHLGSDAMYRTITLNKSIVLEPGQTFDLDILLDVRDLYDNGVGVLDLMEPDNQVTHNPEQIEAATFIATNYQSAFTVD